VGVARRVRLGLEERVEVPEAGLDVAVRWHLAEAHLEQDLAELGAHAHQRVEVAPAALAPLALEVIPLEGVRLPAAAVEHLLGDVRGEAAALRRPVRPPLEAVRRPLHGRGELALLQVLEELVVQRADARRADDGPLGLHLGELGHELVRARGGHQAGVAARRLVARDPLVLHALAEADLEDVLADRGLEGRLVRHPLGGHGREGLRLRGALGNVAERLRRQRPQLSHNRRLHQVPLRDEAQHRAHHGFVLERALLGPRPRVLDRRGADRAEEQALHSLRHFRERARKRACAG
jgi:hypothetical protein